mgnify:CR=1 FL=1
MEKDFLDREHGLQELAKAYISVKNGDAGCVMIVLEDDSMMVHTCNISAPEALRATTKAVDVLGQAIYKALSELERS